MYKFIAFLFTVMSVCIPAQASEHGVILLYHHVDSDTPPSTTISPSDFKAHLEYLRDNDFNVIPLDTMIDSLQKQQALPERAVAITFDDGYISIFEQAFPMLQEFGYPFTLFVSTDPINRAVELHELGSDQGNG
jgi:peptidoglycan/xylan/chitin deacetylase (PgdA/CDA1 family)